MKKKWTSREEEISYSILFKDLLQQGKNFDIYYFDTNTSEYAHYRKLDEETAARLDQFILTDREYGFMLSLLHLA